MNRFEDAVKRITINPILRNLGKIVEKRNFSDEPVFVTASPRSGTTLLLAIIGAIPNIFAVPEQTYAFDRWKKVRNRPYQYYPYRIDRLYRYFLFYGFDKNATRWCEKTPRHVEHIEKIVDFYGGKVKLIHLIRDGRDVVVSKHPKHRPNEYWVSPNRWLKSVRYAWGLRDKPYLYTVFYEDLVRDYRPYLKEICEFIGEPYTKGLENWMEKTNVQKSKHWGHKVKPVSTSAIGKWKKPEHKQRIEEFMNNEECVEMMKVLGYIK
ncbi:sulfotransferase [bacterium]|nr:sulfotransferase [bacterium]